MINFFFNRFRINLPLGKILGHRIYSVLNQFKKFYSQKTLFAFVDKKRKCIFENKQEVWTLKVIINYVAAIVCFVFLKEYVAAKSLNHPSYCGCFGISTTQFSFVGICFFIALFVYLNAAFCVNKTSEIGKVFFAGSYSSPFRKHSGFKVISDFIKLPTCFDLLNNTLSVLCGGILKIKAYFSLFFSLYKEMTYISNNTLSIYAKTIKIHLCLPLYFWCVVYGATKCVFKKIKAVPLFAAYTQLAGVIFTYFSDMFSFSVDDLKVKKTIPINVSGKIGKFKFIHNLIIQVLKLKSNRMLEAAAKIEQNQYTAVIG